MKTAAILASVQGTFGADGTCTVYIGPTVFGHTWTVDLTGISTESPADTEFLLYRDVVDSSSLIGGSWSGNQDFAQGTLTLGYGSRLVGVWSGGTEGATATLVLSGKVANNRD